jgi:subtilisin-like proprotein convertase family protein
VTQQFYAANWYHDRLFNLGFDEASANFQQSNLLGLGGVGGDRVLIDVQDQSGTNNANFSTPPDGASGRAQMFRFTFPTIDRDGGLDTEILFHELTHGTSNRLVGNGAGLNWDPAAGMGEGWSDFYALALLNNTNADDPNGQYGAGAYATFKFISAAFLDNYLYAIRRFPYETDNTVNPLTWDDVDEVTAASTGGIPQSPIDGGTAGAMEVHAVGEVWAISLWEVRSRIIAAAAGNVPVGNQTTLELVTDGLKATPVDPTFVEARDAILDADCTTNACANEDHIWGGFADRGLGYGARTPYYLSFAAVSSHMGIRTSTALPNLDTLTIAVDDNVFGNNINGVIDPGETVNLNVTLRNPWRNPVRAVASATGTLTSPSAAVSMLDGVGAWGPIAQQASTAASDVFQIRVAQSAACGSALDFSLTVNSTLGAVIRTFRIRVGLPSGTDAPVTYTQTHNPVLAIPDADLRGVKSTIVVPDDFEIADLNFQVNSITHPWSGDVSVALRSPAATGIDMIADVGLLPGGTFPGNFDGNSGDNFVNVLIDDDIASNAGNDIVQTTSAAAPFTGDWLPPYNSPWTALPSAFGLPPDPVGNLSVMDGESTLGTWTAVVADQAAPDTGTLGGWSLIVTPRHFTCTTVPVELLSIDVE